MAKANSTAARKRTKLAAVSSATAETTQHQRLTDREKIDLLGRVCCSTAFIADQIARLGNDVTMTGGQEHIGETLQALASRLDMLGNAGINLIHEEVVNPIRQIEGIGPHFDGTDPDAVNDDAVLEQWRASRHG